MVLSELFVLLIRRVIGSVHRYLFYDSCCRGNAKKTTTKFMIARSKVLNWA